jgi:phenylacetate-coenzyme A ligase PaaK-like adenylate-forming protein
LAQYRERALKELIRICKTKSKWHRSRLEKIDPETFTEVDLPHIPPMTKADLMENFDEIVTSPDLDLERCEQHIESGETYLDGEFCVFASGGSSGVRAVSIFGWEESARNYIVGRRFMTRWAVQTKSFRSDGPPVNASIAAAPGAHGTHHLSLIFGGGEKNTFAVTDPIDSIIDGLNRIKPDILHVYPSLIPRLIAAAEGNLLHIRPVLLLAGAEPLLDEHQDAVLRMWGCPIFSSWGATEVGLMGSNSGFDPGLMLYDDHVVIEPADADDHLVKPGVRADKLFVTPLFHHVLPVIRYEITDQLTVLDQPATCGSNFTRTSLIEGRLDDYFIYNQDVQVHPHAFRTVFGQCKNIHEYQVQQTPAGALIKIVSKGEPDVQAIPDKIIASLKRLGLANPEIEIKNVSAIQRTGSASKLKRFVPLGGCV